MTSHTDDPLATCNIKKGDSPGAISGMEFLRRWHSRRNENHPLRIQERQAEAQRIAAARQALVPTPSEPRPQKKQRVKRVAPRPDADGKYRL